MRNLLICFGDFDNGREQMGNGDALRQPVRQAGVGEMVSSPFYYTLVVVLRRYGPYEPERRSTSSDNNHADVRGKRRITLLALHAPQT